MFSSSAYAKWQPSRPQHQDSAGALILGGILGAFCGPAAANTIAAAEGASMVYTDRFEAAQRREAVRTNGVIEDKGVQRRWFDEASLPAPGYYRHAPRPSVFGASL